ncbi:hypothetical protein ACQEVC_42535 [Plantactinospora sp. CA-294935]|uniref:hypothetical protein n=1 Tax=Plantactinospora sp. CA-294935 TaxID=3240012 RepID=UPI003D8F0D9A
MEGSSVGLFVDRVFPPQPLYERYTLLSCTPSGPLLAAVDGTGPAWFGNLIVEGAHVPGRRVSQSCVDQCRGCYDTVEELFDVRVVGYRPAAEEAGLLDIDIEGHRREGDNNRGGTVPPAVFGYRLITYAPADGSVEETPASECRDIAGLFHERPDTWPPGPPLTLLGCRPGLTGSFEADLAHGRVDGTVHKTGWGQRRRDPRLPPDLAPLRGRPHPPRPRLRPQELAARRHLHDLVHYLTQDGVQLELR